MELSGLLVLGSDGPLDGTSACQGHVCNVCLRFSLFVQRNLCCGCYPRAGGSSRLCVIE